MDIDTKRRIKSIILISVDPIRRNYKLKDRCMCQSTKMQKLRIGDDPTCFDERLLPYFRLLKMVLPNSNTQSIWECKSNFEKNVNSNRRELYIQLHEL